jgi:hypothetical protein
MRTDRAIVAALLVVGVPPDAEAATPFTLAPCRIGGRAIGSNTPLVTIRAALSHAFPRARLIDAPTPEPQRRRLRVMEGHDLLLTVTYYPHAHGQPPASILFQAPRFLLIPGVGPDSSLVRVARAAGPVTISYNPEIGVETLDAPGLRNAYGAWEHRGCTVNLRLGPDARVGRYGPGRTDTDRHVTGARITGIEVEFS